MPSNIDCPGADSAAGCEAPPLQHITYKDGSTYTGYVVDGQRQGYGVYNSLSGLYEGQWQADVQHGNGRQTWSDGRVYEGEFGFGKFEGTGRMTWHTQKGMMMYEGQYKDDLKHGNGKFAWSDGRTYEGEWSRGKRHGRGVYTSRNSEHRVGYWSHDRLDHWEESFVKRSMETVA